MFFFLDLAFVLVFPAFCSRVLKSLAIFMAKVIFSNVFFCFFKLWLLLFVLRMMARYLHVTSI